MATKVEVNLDDAKFSGALDRIGKNTDKANSKLSTLGNLLKGSVGFLAATKGAEAFRGALSIMASEGTTAGTKLQAAFTGVNTALARLADDPAIDSFVSKTADLINSSLVPTISKLPGMFRDTSTSIGDWLSRAGEYTGLFADGTTAAYREMAVEAKKSLDAEAAAVAARNKALRDAKALRDLDNADQDRAFAKRLQREGLGMTTPEEQEENIRLQRQALTEDGLTDEAKQRINRSIQKSITLLEEFERMGERLKQLQTATADAKKSQDEAERDRQEEMAEQAIRDTKDQLAVEEMLHRKRQEASEKRAKLMAEQTDLERTAQKLRESGHLTEEQSAKISKRQNELTGQLGKMLGDQIEAEKEINTLRQHRVDLMKQELDRMNEVHARMRDERMQKDRERAEARAERLAGAFGGGGANGAGGGGPQGQHQAAGRNRIFNPIVGPAAMMQAVFGRGGMPAGDGAALMPQGGGGARNPADRLVEALNPDAIRKRILQAKLKEIDDERKGPFPLLPGEERRLRRRENNLRRDVEKGIVGGKGGIGEADVAKALADEAGKQVDFLAKQRGFNQDMVEALKKAAKAAADAAAEAAENKRVVEQVNEMLDKIGPLLRINARRRAAVAGRG